MAESSESDFEQPDAVEDSEAREEPKKRLTPGRILLLLGVFVFGSLVGVGGFALFYGNGIGYLYDDPETCAQCHAMDDYLDGWKAGSHSAVATCNDCHMPPENLAHQLLVKADNGFWHALRFTTGWYPANIEIRDFNRDITNDACLYCHADYVDEVHRFRTDDQQLDCTKCHETVGHLK